MQKWRQIVGQCKATTTTTTNFIWNVSKVKGKREMWPGPVSCVPSWAFLSKADFFLSSFGPTKMWSCVVSFSTVESSTILDMCMFWCISFFANKIEEIHINTHTHTPTHKTSFASLGVSLCFFSSYLRLFNGFYYYRKKKIISQNTHACYWIHSVSFIETNSSFWSSEFLVLFDRLSITSFPNGRTFQFRNLNIKISFFF